ATPLREPRWRGRRRPRHGGHPGRAPPARGARPRGSGRQPGDRPDQPEDLPRPADPRRADSGRPALAGAPAEPGGGAVRGGRDGLARDSTRGLPRDRATLTVAARLVLLVLDGFSPRHLTPAIAPNLVRAGEDGARPPGGGRAVLTAATYPNHASLVTGVEPAEPRPFANNTFT